MNSFRSFFFRNAIPSLREFLSSNEYFERSRTKFRRKGKEVRSGLNENLISNGCYTIAIRRIDRLEHQSIDRERFRAESIVFTVGP